MGTVVVGGILGAWVWSASKWLRISASLADATELPLQEQQDILAALRTINQQVNDPDGNLERLILDLDSGAFRIFEDDDVPEVGLHFHLAPQKLYINPTVKNHGPFAQALAVYAEYQHDPQAATWYPNDDEAVQAAFDRIRNGLTPAQRNPFIDRLGHGDH